MGFFVLIIGVLIGVCLVLLVEYFIFLHPFVPSDGDARFSPQFLPFRIPTELRELFGSRSGTEELKKKESCVSWNLIFQFLFQELKGTRWFRRWMLKRLQMELNDLTGKSSVGKLVQDIRIRDFAVGSQCPVIKEIRVDKVQLSADGEQFEELDVVMDVEYRGGFHLSVDVLAVLGRKAFLSVKLARVSGSARLRLTRQPYTHWSFAFLEEPIMEFVVDSKFEGRPLAQLVPVVIQQFRRAVRRKHVLPQVKIRYRPFFSNPLLQPSASPHEFSHVTVKGSLEITLHHSSRLQLSHAHSLHHSLVFCTVQIGSKPYFEDEKDQFVSLQFKFIRHSVSERHGLVFIKVPLSERKAGRMVQIEKVESGSSGERTGFKESDIVVAINNMPIISDRQVTKLLSSTLGEMLVLVERRVSRVEEEDEWTEHFSSNSPIRNLRVRNVDNEFLSVEFDTEGMSRSGSVSSVSSLIGKSRSMTDLSRVGTGSGEPSAPSTVLLAPENHSPRPLRKVRSAVALQPLKCSQNQRDSVQSPPRPHSRTYSTSHAPSTDGPPDGDTGIICIPPRPATPPPNYGLHLTAGSSGPSGYGQGSNYVSEDCNPSPSMTRRQKLLAKATEKGTQVASKWQVSQKWQTGKATVKGLWNKRKVTGMEDEVSGETAESYDSSGEASQASISRPSSQASVRQPSVNMSNSKSEESKLSVRIQPPGAGIVMPELIVSRFQTPFSNVSSHPPPHSPPHTDRGRYSYSESTRPAEEQESEEKEGDPAGKRVSRKESAKNLRYRSNSESEALSLGTNVKFMEQCKGEMNQHPTRPTSASITDPTSMGGTEREIRPMSDNSPASELSASETHSSSKRNSKSGGPPNEKRTSSMPLSSDVSWEQATRFPLNEKSKYINLAVWSCEPQETEKTLLGHVNVCVPEILDDCSITISHFHQQTFSLRPSHDAHASIIQKYQKLSQFPGFDTRLCQGDVTVSFQWRPDEKLTTEDWTGFYEVQSKVDGGSGVEGIGGGNTVHRWNQAHFQQAVFCGFCQRKIWLKSANQCSDCLLICHKKCLPKAEETKACNRKPTESDKTLSDCKKEDPLLVSVGVVEGEEEDTALEAVTVSLDEKSLRSDAVGKGRRLQLALTEKISNLRRRRPHSSNPTDRDSYDGSEKMSDTDLFGVLPVVDSSSGPAPQEEENDNSQFLLYTKGGTYNENVINAAKDLGKNLFLEMTPIERKSKINEQIDRLHKEIDLITQERHEVLQKQQTKAGSSLDIKDKIAKLDDKLQGLAVLMLHYCAGLQHCVDRELEEGEGSCSQDTPHTSADLTSEASDPSSKIDGNGNSISESRSSTQNFVESSPQSSPGDVELGSAAVASEGKVQKEGEAGNETESAEHGQRDQDLLHLLSNIHGKTTS